MSTTKTSTKPQFQTVGDKFYWRPPTDSEPVEYVIPLKFKTGIYRRMAAAGDVIFSLAVILDEVELPAVLAALDDLDWLDGNRVAETYFEALRAQNGATPGE